MRMSVVNFLLLFLLFNTAKGIRLEQHFLTSIQRIHTQEAELERSEIPEKKEVCREGEICSGGNNRKLMMIKRREAMASSPKSKSMMEIKASAAKSPNRETSPENYPDIFDIAGMDYSPAKKKSPIHN